MLVILPYIDMVVFLSFPFFFGNLIGPTSHNKINMTKLLIQCRKLKLTNLLSSPFAVLQNFLNASSIFSGVLFVLSSRDSINLFRNLTQTAT